MSLNFRHYVATVTDGRQSRDVSFSDVSMSAQELHGVTWNHIQDADLDVFPRGVTVWLASVRDEATGEVLLAENLR